MFLIGKKRLDPPPSSKYWFNPITDTSIFGVIVYAFCVFNMSGTIANAMMLIVRAVYDTI